MNIQKIAILVDSGSDVPKEMVKKYKMYVAPLTINYKDEQYTDGVDISAEEVYRRLESEIPSTSLPSPTMIQSIFDQIKVDGYERVLAVTISSGLSGTYNIIRMLGEEQEDLDVFVVDSKNISIASGFNAIQAAQYIEEGMDWESLKKTLTENTGNSRVFFCVSTLKYLQKGGRIGLVASILGETISMKPIISCNEEGIYYTVSKTLGESRALNKALELAIEFIGDSQKYNLGVVHAGVQNKADKIRTSLITSLPNYKILVDGEISPALGVHTGPGAIGVVVQKL
ncbi:MAG: DegV family protein [Tissierellia bacterium]|nr:DegV family protein [Tissierellia bacterium]